MTRIGTSKQPLLRCYANCPAPTICDILYVTAPSWYPNRSIHVQNRPDSPIKGAVSFHQSVPHQSVPHQSMPHQSMPHQSATTPSTPHNCSFYGKITANFAIKRAVTYPGWSSLGRFGDGRGTDNYRIAPDRCQRDHQHRDDYRNNPFIDRVLDCVAVTVRSGGFAHPANVPTHNP